MDPRLLNYYEDELRFLREMGAEFGAAYPNVMRRLGLDSTPCADPYVERLLEGVAFLAARVQLKLDARHPDFTEHLLQIVYPHFLAPIPSCAIVQFNPLLTEGSLLSGVTIARHSLLRTVLAKGERTACEFRTAHPVTLWPLEIIAVKYLTGAGTLGNFGVPPIAGARAALRITLRSAPGVAMRSLALDELVLHIKGAGDDAPRLYEQLFANTLAVVAKRTGAGAVLGQLAASSITPVGFDDEESLLPVSDRSFSGYRLLQEYFTCPERFQFFRVRGLRAAFSACDAQEIDLYVVFDRVQTALENALDPAFLRLNCTPIINLFPRNVDRVHVTPTDIEYHVVADRNRPMDLEIFSIERMRAIWASGSPEEIVPFYAVRHRVSGPQPGYYTLQRRLRLQSESQRLRGTRSAYVGTEIYVSVSAGDASWAGERTLRQLDIDALCTNRDLPLGLLFNTGRTDLVLDGAAPIESIRCIHAPTPPRTSPAFGDTAWRLVSHLSLNYLSLIDSAPESEPHLLRELLGLYVDKGNTALGQQIEGLRHIHYETVVKRIPVAGPISFGRGLGISLQVDEAAFAGTGAMLLAAVLERFFARYVSLNSFVQFRLIAQGRGLIKQWPVRIGTRPVL
jgi:type VI secretion system protein ImpG